MKFLKLIVLLIYISNQFSFSQNDRYEDSKIVYEADKNGKPISGNIEALLEHARNGKQLRVGWVLEFKNSETGKIETIEHWSDAGFITIINNHIFAQINPIAQQSPKLSNPPEIRLIDGKANGWVAIIGTTGVLEQHFTENAMMTRIVEAMKKRGASEEEISKRLESMRRQNVKTKWAVNNP